MIGTRIILFLQECGWNHSLWIILSFVLVVETDDLNQRVEEEVVVIQWNEE